MTISAAQPPPVAPITPAQRDALAAAKRAAGRLAFAPKLATFNGAGLLLAAAVSLAWAWTDPWLLAVALLLGVSGWVELESGKRLRRYRREAPVRLAVNQLVLLVLVVGYAAARLAAALTGEVSLAAELGKHPELAGLIENADDPQLRAAIEDMSGWVRAGMIATYGSLIVASLVAQGGMALYYWSRRKYVSELLERTPAWVLEVLTDDRHGTLQSR